MIKPGQYGEIFFTSIYVTKNGTYLLKLGNLTVKVNDSDQFWPIYYSKKTDTVYKNYQKKCFSHMEYEYNALHGDLTNVYTSETLHKVSNLPSDLTIRNLYGKKLSVMHNDVDTYYNVDIKTHLKHSLQSKKDWII